MLTTAGLLAAIADVQARCPVPDDRRIENSDVEPGERWASDGDGDWHCDREDERNDRAFWGGAA